MFVLAYIKVKSPDTSSNIVTPPATTSTPINWTANNKWANSQLQISLGKFFNKYELIESKLFKHT